MPAPSLRHPGALLGALTLAWTLALTACGSGDETPAPAPAPAPTRSAPVERPEDIPPPPPPPTAATQPAPTMGEGAGDERMDAATKAADEEILAEALNDLRDPDPEVRADAVLDIEPEGVGLRTLIDTLRDPDPEVRMAAISQLEDADENPEAIAGIVSAFGDDDPEVVLEAIDAIEFVGGPGEIGSLQPLLGHPNEEVREAAQEAIEYLEE